MLEATPGGVLLTTRVEDLDWAARYVVGFGCPFVVRRPPELCAALRRLAAEITAQVERAASSSPSRPASARAGRREPSPS